MDAGLGGANRKISMQRVGFSDENRIYFTASELRIILVVRSCARNPVAALQRFKFLTVLRNERDQL
jgi:hypothetical protein